jgi:hypothetical protein
MQKVKLQVHAEVELDPDDFAFVDKMVAFAPENAAFSVFCWAFSSSVNLAKHRRNPLEAARHWCQ